MPHVGLFLSAVTCWEQKQLKCHCCHTAMPNSSKDLTEADTPRQIWLVTHASFPSAPCWLKTFTPKAVWTGDGSHSQTKLGSTSSPRSTRARGWLLPLVTANLFANENGLLSLTSACAMLAADLQSQHDLAFRMGHQWFHSASPGRHGAAESTDANLGVLESRPHKANCYTEC